MTTTQDLERHSSPAMIRALRTGKNAVRLIADAELLKAHERHASAYALAILAFEEVGLLFLAFWGEDDEIKAATRGASRHVRKQVAAASLLTAEFFRDELRRELGEQSLSSVREIGREDLERYADRLAAKAMGADAPALLDNASVGVLDISKQLGLYSDLGALGLDFTHGDFSESDVEGVLEAAKRALALLREFDLFPVARSLLLSWPIGERSRRSREQSANSTQS